MRFSTFAAIGVLLTASIPYGYAQDTAPQTAEQTEAAQTQQMATPENAEKLKAIFQKGLDYQKSVSGGIPDGMNVIYDGELTVEPVDNYYAITLPHIRLEYPDGAQLDFGMVSLNASAHEEPGMWKMTMAIPTPILFLDKDELEVIRVDIGGQRAGGIYSEELETFSKLDANYKDIKITSIDPPFEIDVPNTLIRYNYTKDANGLWSGPAKLALQDIQFKFAGSPAQASIGEFALEGSMKNYDPAIMKITRDQMMDLSKNMPAFDPNTPLTQDQQQKISQLYQLIFDMIAKSTNALDFKYSVSDLNITRPKVIGQGTDGIQLDNAHFGIGFDEMKSGTPDFQFSFGANNVKVSPAPPGMEDYMPHTALLSFKINNIPFAEFAKMGQDAVSNPQAAQMMGLTLMMTAPQILSNAGTSIEIENNKLIGDKFSVDFNATMNADNTAVMQGTVDAKATIKGLDEMVNELEQKIAEGQAEQNPQIAIMLAQLSQLKLLGEKQETAEGEQSQYSYHYVVNKQGQMLLNGQDVSNMAGGMTGAPPTTETTIEPQAIETSSSNIAMQLTQFGSQLRTTSIRMIMDGKNSNQIEFNTPMYLNNCSMDGQNCVFHPNGGGLEYMDPPDFNNDGILNDWVINKRNQVFGLGKTTEEKNRPEQGTCEIIAFLDSVPENICLTINKNIGLDIIPEEDRIITGQNMEKTPSAMNGPQANQCEGGTIGGDITALNSQPYGCFQEDGINYYFHVLVEE